MSRPPLVSGETLYGDIAPEEPEQEDYLEGIDNDRGLLIGTTNIIDRFDEVFYFNWDGQMENLTPARSTQLIKTNYFFDLAVEDQNNLVQSDTHFFSGYDSLTNKTELF